MAENKFDDFNDVPELKFDEGDVVEVAEDAIEIVEDEATEASETDGETIIAEETKEEKMANELANAEKVNPADTLTPKEMEQVKAFVSKIDINNTQAIMNYGVGTQKKIADFSEKALENVKTKDMGEVGDMISSLVTQLKTFDDGDEKKGLAGLFKKKGNNLQTLKNK